MTRTRKDAPPHTTYLVQNQSERRGPVLAVEVHSTESQDQFRSRQDLVAIRHWFDNPSSSASAHIGVDGDGNTEVWVPSTRKAWATLDANDFTVNIEFIARAAQSAKAWEEAQIKEGAKWAAYWAIKYDLPVQRGRVKNVHGQCVCTKKGILTHKDITDAGFGSHIDPGPTFPMNDFLKAIRYYKTNGWEL